MSLTKERRQDLGIRVGYLFSPAAPIDKAALFAGRSEQVRRLIDTLFQRGQHAIIFGERGVGKTSLANVLSEFLERPEEKILSPKINCDGRDTYSSLWRRLFSEIPLPHRTQEPGFLGEISINFKTVADSLPEEIDPGLVRRVLASIGSSPYLLIVIIDEFDRLENSEARRLFADTIKMLSDYSVPATLILVGVADTVDELIEEHQSVERALVQVRMPRMSREELHEIINKGISQIEMKADNDALQYMSFLSQGLPHYTHLLGLYSARQAIDRGSLTIASVDVDAAMEKAITDAQQSVQRAYHNATMSTRKKTLYPQVLLACAMAQPDELGYFAAADVRAPMSMIMRKSYDIPAFSRHLNDFCDERRGPIFQKTGYRHRFRFRFVNPLMQPF